jgi:hypothetical protein
MAKAWTATIFDSNGIQQYKINAKGEAEPLTKGFDKAARADGWADLRLVEGATGWYATITHATMRVSTTITRDDAMARVYGRKGPGPVTHSAKGSNQKLGFGVKVSQTRVTFSHG